MVQALASSKKFPLSRRQGERTAPRRVRLPRTARGVLAVAASLLAGVSLLAGASAADTAERPASAHEPTRHQPAPAFADHENHEADLSVRAALAAAGDADSPASDPFVYLEAVASPAARAWVDQQNARTLAALTSDARFAPLVQRLTALLDAPDRLPAVDLHGSLAYNFWQDSDHPRGLWRRAPVGALGAATVPWETVLDLDALARTEHEDWVWSAATCLQPSQVRCMIALSRGGKDAAVKREFDVVRKAFVSGGFVLPEGKSTFAWLDQDNALITTDYTPATRTNAGYPAQVALWQRGTPWQQARPVFQGKATDESVGAEVWPTFGGTVQIVEEDTSFFLSKRWLRQADGTLAPLVIPDDASTEGVFAGRLVLRLNSAWTLAGTTFTAGSVVAYDPQTAQADLLFAPDARTTATKIAITKSAVVLNVLDNVHSQLLAIAKTPAGTWRQRELPLPAVGTATMAPADPFSSTLLVTLQSFLQPASLYLFDTADAAGTAAPALSSGALIKQSPARFPADQYAFEQYTATSADGTQVPYFLVHKRGLRTDGQNPTLLYGYGGFAVPMVPTYSSILGQAWLEEGGVYVLANIRGGGEFGPAWHDAALKEHRQRAYDDFIAVALDLQARRITDARHLGIKGGSNGGLLVGAVMVQRPELFHAVLCDVPLLDMLRFPLIGAGASWEGEYGDPAIPAQRAFLERYSPYQNVRADSEYPRPFFLTSTDDDRVGPGHARKMAAKLQANGQAYLFYETAHGGHATPASIADEAQSQALQYVYLYQQLR